jgi:RNA polymerase sigma factor (sigma-70 family)
MSNSALTDSVRFLRGKLALQQRREDSDEQLLRAFVAQRDENAFAVLVRRHGSMVLHVCRRVLEHEQDAEDAFQATFLVLARNADSLRRKSSLASFLHGTANRLARNAKRAAARRRNYEAKAATRPSINPANEMLWREVRALLDEEIARLPEKYRSVFVLCLLEELSQAEAGRRLGLKERTVSHRLAEARKRLSLRLARRGVELTAVLAASKLTAASASALPPGLTAISIKAAMATATGDNLAGVVSAAVAEIVQSEMAASKVKMAVVVLLVASMLTGAGLWEHLGLDAPALAPSAFRAPETPVEKHTQPIPPAQSAAKPKEPNNTPNEKDQKVEIAGTVVDPDGKPFPRANIYFLARLRTMQTEPERDFAQVRAIADANGRFRFGVYRNQVQVSENEETYFGHNTHPNAVVTAVGAGHGPGWTAIHKIDEAGHLTLKLARDDVPIRGRVVNLEGQPIQGVKVRVMLVMPMRTESLLPWLVAQHIQRNDRSVIWQYQGAVIYPEAAGLEKAVATDAEGRFQLRGIGRERVAELRFEGPTIETRTVSVLTRPAPTFEVQWRSPDLTLKDVYHGATFDHVAAPTVPIIGTVRDKDTGKPLAGIIIQTDSDWDPTASYLRTVTDKDGHYRLVGLPKKPSWVIRAYSGPVQRDEHYRFAYSLPKKPSWTIRENTGTDQCYVRLGKKVRSGIGLDPVRADFEMKRGVLIHGRVTDKTSGQPVQAEIQYHLFSDNRTYVEGAGNWEEGGPISTRTGEDGSFSLVGLPGRGIVAAKAWSAKTGLYIVAAGADRIKGANQDGIFPTYPFVCVPTDNHSLQEINPGKDAASLLCSVFLDRGKTVTGTVVDPEGKSLTGVRMEGPWGIWQRLEQLKTSRFTVTAINPNMPQWVFFFHKEKRLGAALRLTGNEPKDFTVRLERCATITGRIVDGEGRPRAGLMLVGELGPFQHRPTVGSINGAGTDKAGRFYITGVLPGLKWRSVDVAERSEYIGYLLRDVTFHAGELRDLGNLQVSR